MPGEIRLKNFYEIIGVPQNATDTEIRQQYRKLARKYHPDLNPGDKTAETKFKEITEAYEVLSDPKSRKKYNLYGENWKQVDGIGSKYRRGPHYSHFRQGNQERDYGGFTQSNLFGGLGDLFERNRRPSRSRRNETGIELGLEEAYSGTKKRIAINSGGGKSRQIEVTIPPGVDTGSVIRISPGKGQQIIINISITPHKRFIRKDDDLITKVEIPLEDAILGGEINVTTLTGEVLLKVPAESQNGQRIRLAGQGMPKLNHNDIRGYLYVEIRPILPKNLTEEQRDLVIKLKDLRSK